MRLLMILLMLLGYGNESYTISRPSNAIQHYVDVKHYVEPPDAVVCMDKQGIMTITVIDKSRKDQCSN